MLLVRRSEKAHIREGWNQSCVTLFRDRHLYHIVISTVRYYGFIPAVMLLPTNASADSNFVPMYVGES